MVGVEYIMFTFQSQKMAALDCGALWWPAQDLLVVSDLHLGKSERIARRQGSILPPYETAATLGTLEAALDFTSARNVICLGDSFDDLKAAENLSADVTHRLDRMAAGRGWTWITGNHDPGPVSISGEHRLEIDIGGVTFRHEALANATSEVSGHFHPKAWVNAAGRRHTKPSFLIDSDRLIMPAMGHYTGDLRCTDPALATLMGPDAVAILTGSPMLKIPMPRAR